jgi:hypothetical protein
MSNGIPESDWRTFRELQALALERFCQRVLDDIARISADSTRTSHERYLEIYRLTQERDMDLAHAFEAPRRSQMILQLVVIHSMGLLEPEELLRFTGATQETILSLKPTQVAES